MTDSGPRLFLWNLLHTKSAATAAFNAAELARLSAHLSAVLEKTLDDGLLHDAVEAEARRAEVLQALPSGGVDAFAARNAGRWMTPEEHCELLDSLPQSSGPRIVLVGTSCDIPVLHEVCCKHGQVTADLQDYGRVQPCATTACELLEDDCRRRACAACCSARTIHRARCIPCDCRGRSCGFKRKRQRRFLRVGVARDCAVWPKLRARGSSTLDSVRFARIPNGGLKRAIELRRSLA